MPLCRLRRTAGRTVNGPDRVTTVSGVDWCFAKTADLHPLPLVHVHPVSGWRGNRKQTLIGCNEARACAAVRNVRGYNSTHITQWSWPI